MVDFNKIEKKWQNEWEKSKIFQVKDSSEKKKFYCLEMFPYPSGSGLHMGHAFNYSIGDIYSRFKRMHGFNILYPMGYDSFGLPAENAAIKAKSHPSKFTDESIHNFIRQQKELGLSYDWTRMIKTSDPEYYKWNQYFFLKFMEKGLVYRKKAIVNWCPECNTVLANEQVHNCKCWRHTDTDVETKQLEQWFIKITDYSEKLLKGLEKLDWPERIKLMQENWIGKSQGTLVNFKLSDQDKHIQIFTTRPDTLYGVTFLVYAPEHSDVLELVKDTKYEYQVKEFLKKVLIQDRFSRSEEDKEKDGLFIGKYAINPLTNEKVPIYIANFVLPDYGTGCIMSVPAHDQRDLEFAKKYNIPIKVVINPKSSKLQSEKMEKAYIGEGVLVNSDKFSGMNNKEAIKGINKYLESKKIGKVTFQYKLRDWLISRQRYWGTPIPMVYCDKCGIVPVPEKDLPVLLPKDVKFGQGNPLETSKSFIETKCPKCNGDARRETDTMDTFVDSSWYFLRYCDNKNNKKPFDKSKTEYWCPVDQYIGGAEHACMHLIYSRFFTKALHDLGFLKFDEPFNRLFNQGMLHKEGVVMSKSRGNVVLPEEVSKKYGIDTARLFLMSIASPDKDLEWSEEGVSGSFKFINKVFSYFENYHPKKSDKKIESKLHKTIKVVTENIENFKYNLTIIQLKEFFNSLPENVDKKTIETFLKLFHPFCPHITEELWEKIGNKGFISLEKWPKYDKSKIDLKLDELDNFINITKSDIRAILKLVKKEPSKITIFVSESWKYDLFKKIKQQLEKTFNLSEVIKAVMDKQHTRDISKIVPPIIKNPAKLPNIILSQQEEIKSLKSSIDDLTKEFKCSIEITESEKSSNPKSRNSSPGKPAILVE